MTLGPATRRIILAVAVVLLLALVWTGLTGGIRDLRNAENVGQSIQCLSQVAYALLSLLVVATVRWGHRWRRVIRSCWAVSVALAAGLATVVWGEEGVFVGLVAAAGGLLIALAILWLLRIGTRRVTGA